MRISSYCQLDKGLIEKNLPEWVKEKDVVIEGRIRRFNSGRKAISLGSFYDRTDTMLGGTVCSLESLGIAFSRWRFKDFWLGMPPILAFRMDVFLQKDLDLKLFKEHEAENVLRGNEKEIQKKIKELSRFRFAKVKRIEELIICILAFVEPLYRGSFSKVKEFKLDCYSLLTLLKVDKFDNDSVRHGKITVVERFNFAKMLSLFSLRILKFFRDPEEIGKKLY